MEIVMAGLAPAAFWAAVAVTLFSGFVKGAIGFAMPMIMIAAFSSFLSPETALAWLILPVLLTNISQALRQGWAAALATARDYWRFLLGTVVFIVISAQFVRDIPQPVFLLLLGLPITIFALLQLTGRTLALRLEHRNRAEALLGVVGGLYGGVSGIWGPPLVVYLLSVGADKTEAIRVQGVVFLIGAAVLTGAHLNSGILNAATLPFSLALSLPATAGMTLGYALQDRLDQRRFRSWTQILLIVTGLNLMRQALWG